MIFSVRLVEDDLETMLSDADYMAETLKLAEAALEAGEFPVGCIIVDRDKIVVRAHRVGSKGIRANEIDHAEIIALQRLADRRDRFDPAHTTLYCTMEPCLMCYGAIILSGIRRIVYAYEDDMGGATGCSFENMAPLYRSTQITVVANVLRDQSLKLFKRYFADPQCDYWRDSHLARYTLKQ